MDGDELHVLETKHRTEKKELQAQIQALKKTIKGDKTKKKEVTAEIARLESEIEIRHKEELESVKSEVADTEDISQLDFANELPKLKISKAQRRRDKKSLQEKERELEIKQQEKENLFGPRNVENHEISSKLKDMKLKMFSIPSDGDCLYKAISHQLEAKRQKSIFVQELRKMTSDYIRENKHEFLPFMSNSETYTMLSDAEFDDYCDKIVTSNVWGGQLEVRALSNTLKCPINIIQANGPSSILQGEEFSGPPLIITYHRHMYKLGEHYNSTRAFSDEE